MGRPFWRVRYFPADLMRTMLAQDYEGLARQYQAVISA